MGALLTREATLLAPLYIEQRDWEQVRDLVEKGNLLQALWHEELIDIKDSPLQRLRSNLFKMLREADLLSSAGDIMPAMRSERVATALAE